MTDLLTFIEATKGTSLRMNKKHKIFDVGKMWGKKIGKPS